MRTWTQFGSTMATHSTFRVGSSSSTFSNDTPGSSFSGITSSTVNTDTYTTTRTYQTFTTRSTSQSDLSQSATYLQTGTNTFIHPRLITTASTETTRFSYGTDTESTTSTYTTAQEVTYTATSSTSSTALSTYSVGETSTNDTTLTITAAADRISTYASQTVTSQTGTGTNTGTSSSSTTFSGTAGSTYTLASYLDTGVIPGRHITDFPSYYLGEVLYYVALNLPYGSTSTGRFSDFWISNTASSTVISRYPIFYTNSGQSSASTIVSGASNETYSDTTFSNLGSSGWTTGTSTGYVGRTTTTSSTTTIRPSTGETWNTLWTSQFTQPRLTFKGKPGDFDRVYYSRPPAGYIGFGGSFDLTTPIYASLSASLISGSEPPGSTIDANFLAFELYSASAGRLINAFPVRTVTTPLHMPPGGQNYLSSISLTGTATFSTIFTDTDSVRYAATYAIWPTNQITGDYFSTASIESVSAFYSNERITGYCAGQNEFGNPYTISLAGRGIAEWTQRNSTSSSTGSTSDDRGFVTFTFPADCAIRFVADQLWSADYIPVLQQLNMRTTRYRTPTE
jgi:hypothetical protein